MTKSEFRIALSIGLLVALVAHALTLATAQRAMPHIERAIMGDKMADSYPEDGINFDNARSSGRPVNTLPVNSAARDEIKRAPATTSPTTNTAAANEPKGGRRLVPTQPAPQQCVNCVPAVVTQPAPLPLPVAKPATPVPTGATAVRLPADKVTPKPTTARYGLSVFVLHDDPTSQEVLSWFNTQPNLVQFSRNADYQVYTKDNPLYKARYASTVPANRFPAILVTDPTGGHVYYADRVRLPASGSTAAAEMRQAVELQRSIVSRNRVTAPAGLLTSATSPQASLLSIPNVVPNANDIAKPLCPDGTCEPKTPLWKRPFDRDDGDGGGLFPDDTNDSVQGILRLIFRPGEQIFMIVIVLAAVVTLVYFLKRGIQ